MAGLQLSGLASGFDWKSLVDQLMDVERAPITRLEREQTTNNSRNRALGDLATKLGALRTAAAALGDEDAFARRTARSGTAGSTWTMAAAAGSAAGTRTFAVSQLATPSRLAGAADRGAGLAATDDVSGLTLATLATGTAPTAGTFTVDGKQVTVALTDSLQGVFDAISAATGGAVTAAYSAATDRVTLTRGDGQPLVLGAANDTSNLLRVLKLGNNGTGEVASASSLGTLKTASPLATAGLRTAVTAVDGGNAGSFSLNGVAIAFDLDTDSLSGLIRRINQSGAGVTASFDAVNDRVQLVNNAAGDLGIAVSEPAGGLLAALGLGAGGTLTRGQNTLFSVDGGPVLSAPTATLDAAAHGIAGLTVTPDAAGTQAVTVAADTAAMRAKVDAFVTAYNDVQAFIEDRTKVTSANGRVTAAVLSGNREVQDWSRELRRLAFGAVSGVSGSVQRLENLGLDFDGPSGRLQVADEAKLGAALADDSESVEAFFQTAGTGFAARFEDTLERLVDSAGDQQERLTGDNSDIARQIADLERRLVQQRELLTSSFIQMEEAQARIQQQGSALTNAFFPAGGSR
jgi:flagellar hook-associated protein 2